MITEFRTITCYISVLLKNYLTTHSSSTLFHALHPRPMQSHPNTHVFGLSQRAWVRWNPHRTWGSNWEPSCCEGTAGDYIAVLLSSGHLKRTPKVSHSHRSDEWWTSLHWCQPQVSEVASPSWFQNPDGGFWHWNHLCIVSQLVSYKLWDNVHNMDVPQQV